MPRIRSIAVLFHHRQRNARASYRITAMIPNWEASGIRVDLVWGIGRPIEADLLIPHLDLSYIPDDYWDFIQRHPNVVNRRVRDIRKRTLSTNLVRPGDEWSGPVIVKTDMNSRGFSDAQFLGARWRGLMGGMLARKLATLPGSDRLRLGFARTLGRYYVYDNAAAVPRRVWSNPALVVERFRPERDGDLFVLRNWTFFGSHEHARIFHSRDHWVKGINSQMSPLEGRPPAAIVAARERLGMDFGKMDYVIVDGQAILLDVSTCPGMSGPLDDGRIQRSAKLANGIGYYERGDG